jgi:type IV secretory pathway TrbF-like protein
MNSYSSAQLEPKDRLTTAAQRYLEQYGDPLVMNTYLKVTILALSIVCIGLIVALVREQQAFGNLHPLVVRISDIGRAEAIDYNAFNYKPQEAENRYYLAQWAQLYYSRNRFSIQKDFTHSLYFLNGDLQRTIMDRYSSEKTIQTFLGDSSQPNVEIEVKNVSIDDLRQDPYKAHIEFVKIFSNPLDNTELKRERWTASIVYTFRDHVANEMLMVNPLGLTITYFRQDQAFQ